MTDKLTQDEAKLVTSTRRFDLRRILGALFVFYGAIVLVIGLVNIGNQHDLDMTGGLQINIWAGAAMLVLGALFFLWDRLSPVPEEDILKSSREKDAERSDSAA